MSTDDYSNMYWSQVNKRKEIEVENHNIKSEMIREINTLEITNKDLLKRINLLEQNYLNGTIIRINQAYFVIETNIGEFSIHKSKLGSNVEFTLGNMNKHCRFKLYYYRNQYFGHMLDIE